MRKPEAGTVEVLQEDEKAARPGLVGAGQVPEAGGSSGGLGLQWKIKRGGLTSSRRIQNRGELRRFCTGECHNKGSVLERRGPYRERGGRGGALWLGCRRCGWTCSRKDRSLRLHPRTCLGLDGSGPRGEG